MNWPEALSLIAFIALYGWLSWLNHKDCYEDDEETK